MALNFLQKSILRINPSLILNTRVFPEISEDALAFVLSRGFDFRQIPQDRFSEIITKRAFVNELLRLDDQEFINFVNNNMDLIHSIPNKALELDIYERLNGIDINSIDIDSARTLVSQDSRSFIRVLKSNPDFIKDLPKDTYIRIETDFYDAVITEISRSPLQCTDYPNNITENVRAQEFFIQRNPELFLSMYEEGSPNFNEKLDKEIAKFSFKDFIMKDLPSNVKYIERLRMVLEPNGYRIFSVIDFDEIVDEMMRQNIPVTDNSYSGLVNNHKLVIHTILNAKSSNDINSLNYATRYINNIYDRYFLNSRTEEEVKLAERLAETLKRIHYVYNPDLSPKLLLATPESFLALIENDPYTVESINPYDLNNMQLMPREEFLSKVAEVLKKNNYVFSPKTPDIILSLSPEYMLDSYELYYDSYTYIPSLRKPHDMSEEEFDKLQLRQYHILKEHDPDLLTVDKLSQTGNPYIITEAISRGRIPDSEFSNYYFGYGKETRLDAIIKKYMLDHNIKPTYDYSFNKIKVPDDLEPMRQRDIEYRQKYDNAFEEKEGHSAFFDTRPLPEDFVLTRHLTPEDFMFAARDREAAFKSAKNNIYTLLNISDSVQFSDEELKEIAKIYLAGYPETLKNFIGLPQRSSYTVGLPKAISSNPYIQYELLYNNPSRREPFDIIQDSSYAPNAEIEKRVFDSFFSTHDELSFASNPYEKNNLQIALRSITHNPESIRYVSPNLYSNEDIYNLVMDLVSKGEYKIDENTPAEFIGRNYSKLEEDNIDVNSLIESNPKILKTIRARDAINKIFGEYIDSFNEGKMSEDDLVEKFQSVRVYRFSFSKENSSKIEVLLKEHPSLIDKLINAQPALLQDELQDSINKMIGESISKKEGAIEYEIGFDTPSRLLNSYRLETEVYFNKVELIPHLYSYPSYYEQTLTKSRMALFAKINNHSLELPEVLPKDYHFGYYFFDGITEQEYSKLIDEVIEVNPYYISMFSANDSAQDIILSSKLLKLYREKKINYNDKAFNLPEFSTTDARDDYVIGMLREDPTLINTLDYPLPSRNMEEMNFILKTIFESLDSNKPLNSSMIYKTPYISPILYKNMTYVSNLSKDALQDMAPEIEHFFAIRHIPYSEDIPEVLRSFYRPEFRESGYPDGYIAPSLLERKFTVLPPELSDLDQESSYEFLRQNPQYLRVTGLTRNIRDKGYVLRDDDPIAFKLNRSLVTSTILHDPSYIYKLDPIATGISRDSRSIAEILIHQNYQIDRELPDFLKGCTPLMIYAVEQNPENFKYFDLEKLSEDILQRDEVEKYEEILLDQGIYLSEKVNPALRNQNKYIMESLDRAQKPEDIKAIIDTAYINDFTQEEKERFYDKVLSLMNDGKYKYDENSNPQLDQSKDIVFKALEQDISNIKVIAPDTSLFTAAENEAVYELYKKDPEKFNTDPDLMEILSSNPYIKMDKALEDIEHFDEYSFDGVCVSDEYKKQISEILIASNYKVSEKTPRFLLLDASFLISYISKNESIEGIPAKYIAKQFSIDSVSNTPGLAGIYKYCTEIPTQLSKYTQVWGLDSTLELFEKYGSLITYLDSGTKYTIESAKEDLEIYLENNPSMEPDKMVQFYRTLDKKIDEEIFNKNTALRNSEEFIRLAYSQNPNLLFQYRGNDQTLIMLAKEVDPTDSYLKLENFASCDKLLISLMEERSPEYIGYYKGDSEKVVNFSIEKGLYENKEVEYIDTILEEQPLLKSTSSSIVYLIKHYSPAYIEKYSKYDPEVFKVALESGYKVTFEKLLEHELYRDDQMIEEGIKSNPLCHGFRYSSYSDAEKLEVLKTIIGDEAYSKIFNVANLEEKDFQDIDSRTSIEQDFLNLTTIINDPKEGAKFLRLADPKLISAVGFKEWSKIVKYSFENSKIEYLSQAVEQDKVEELIKFQNLISPHIDDNQALGVNKFLTISRFYMQQGSFCKDLLKELDAGRELSEVEIANLQTLIYRESSSWDTVTPSNLKDLISIEKERLSRTGSKDALLTFLFNIDSTEVDTILATRINSRTIAEIHNRAKQDGNEKLMVESDFMGVIVDLIENIKFNYTPSDIDKIIDNLVSKPDESIMKLRKSFGNVKELIRHFYEIEAKEELLDLDTLKENPEFTKEYPGRDEGTTVKVVDVSKMRHTVYAHVYSGGAIQNYFNTANGKVTICVSPETDKHEAYYSYHVDDDSAIRFGFTKLSNGSYVGSAPSNMSSSSYIEHNNFEVQNEDRIYDQRSIRESFDEKSGGHAETLLYRQDLIPTCLIINNLPPNAFQLSVQAELQREVRKQPGHENDEIVFLVTQGAKKRVFNYPSPEQTEKEQQETTEKQKFIQEVRRDFFGIKEGTDSIEQSPFVRNIPAKDSYDQRTPYTIIDGEIFDAVSVTPIQRAAMDITAKLESIAFKEFPDSILDVRDLGQGASAGTVYRKVQTDSRTLWNLRKSSGTFSPETNARLLKEFVIDHLMCNYQAGNDSFILGPNNSISSSGIKNPVGHPLDFSSPDGTPYTSMSYYYYDMVSGNHISGAENNVYRKIFESYITAEDGSEIIKPEAFDHMREFAEEISQIPDEEYMKMFETILENETDPATRGLKEAIIKARKAHIVEDTESFISRVERQRAQEHEVEVIESPETVGIINDIHGNASALEALLDKCEEFGKTDVFILGDMIGFGAQSNECLSLIKERSQRLNIRCILGNHELYSLMGNSSFPNLSYEELNLTSDIRRAISGPNREFLEELPLVRHVSIGGQMVEFTHFPMMKDFVDDKDIFLQHDSGFEQTSSGSQSSYVIFGHEHRTASTTGNQVGTIFKSEVGDTTFINLPSSGCVHGELTTLTTLDIQSKQKSEQDSEQKQDTKDDKKELVANLITVDYDKARNDKAIRETNNPYASHFGTKATPEDEERV